MEKIANNLYRIYFENKDKDFKLYISSVIIGGNPFIRTIPAVSKEDAGIFEKDKAEKYVELINNDDNIKYKAKLEEVKVYVD